VFLQRAMTPYELAILVALWILDDMNSQNNL
jgi:hypothetical protein